MGFFSITDVGDMSLVLGIDVTHDRTKGEVAIVVIIII